MGTSYSLFLTVQEGMLNEIMRHSVWEKKKKSNFFTQSIINSLSQDVMEAKRYKWIQNKNTEFYKE